MTVSAGFLAVLVGIALAVTLLAPAVLVILWWRDWRKGRLW